MPAVDSPALLRRWFLMSFAGLLLAACANAEEIASTKTVEATKAATKPCQTCSPCLTDRPQDQVWLLSTRQLGCSAAGQEAPNWQVWLRNENSWAGSDSEALFVENGRMRTVVYVHGNRVDSNYAVEGGLRVYRHLVSCASEEPVRFIIWSWCSDRIARKGPIRDARIKADYANEEALLFGRFLTKFTPEDEVGLIGFSYGARIITGGLHLVGGGQWMGYRMAPEQEPGQFRVVLWAAAMNNNWLMPGAAHGCAINVCPQWLNMINECDDALKFYPHLDKRDKAGALGYTGVVGKSSIESRGVEFRECTVQHLVGQEHTSPIYPQSPGVMRETRAVILP